MYFRRHTIAPKSVPIVILFGTVTTTGCFNPDDGTATAAMESGSTVDPSGSSMGDPSSTTNPTMEGSGSDGDPRTENTGSSGTDSADPTAGSDGTAGPGSCADGVVDGSAPIQFDSRNRANAYTLTCGVGEGSDIAYEWVAPATDYFAFSTLGNTTVPASNYDTVVGLLAEGCGAELGCANNGPLSEAQALLVAPVVAGQHYTIVVDGNAAGRGDGTLTIEAVSCPESDVTGQPLPVALTTVGGSDAHDGSEHGFGCDPGAGALERSIRYAIPEEGLYRFSVETAEFSPTLYLYRGAACGGPPISCNSNVIDGHPATVTRYFDAGEVLTAVVESSAEGGTFSFDVERLAARTCPNPPALGSGVTGVSLTSNTGGTELDPSCEWAGNAVLNYPDHVYTITVDNTPFTGCDVTLTIDSGLGATLWLLEGGDCRGRELECVDGQDPMGQTLSFFGEDDDGVYTVVVDNTDPFAGTLVYSLQSTCG